MTHDPDLPATPLDAAHRAMMDAPDSDAARLRYYARLADGMLYLMLEDEAQGTTLRPQVLVLDDGPLVMAFDSEERLAEAAGAPVPYAELPGRVVAAQLAGSGIALGINLGVGAGEFLVSPEALAWLAQTLNTAPDQVAARPVAFAAPHGLPPALLEGLDAKLARAGGLAQSAVLAAVEYDTGRRGHMLAFIGARAGAEGALSRAAQEALTFSGLDAGEMDVTFLGAETPAALRIARVGLRFDLPEPVATALPAPTAPGTDPSKPPILR